jgi:histidine triad (HIT) family protein
MYNHVSAEYVCPICLGVKGVENDKTLIRASDIVYKDELVTAFITSFFIGKCPGHIVIVPNEHFEHIYDLPEEYAHRIIDTSKRMALAMKEAYGCEGVMMLQNNEPASGQHAFHYHLHVFPRYEGDDVHAHMGVKQSTTVEERLMYAEMMRRALEG